MHVRSPHARRSTVILAAVVLAGALAAGAPASRAESPAPPVPIDARHGIVSSAHPLATEAGLDILRAGGNAFDAAVAVAAALNVVEPPMSGLGGYGTILVYDARATRVRFLNSSGRVPAAVDSDVFRPPTPDYLENRLGAKAVSTPGNLHAWEALSKEYGTLPWARLFAPAIRLADDGFALDPDAAGLLQNAFASFPPQAQQIYGRDGRALAADDRLVQADLARSYRLIAEQGASALYSGELGQAIDLLMREAGGFLTLSDLTADRAEWWDPIKIDYRGYAVYTASPPAISFDALVRLGMMSRFTPRKFQRNGAAYLHRFAEVSKRAFWVGLRYGGDPEIDPPPLDRLLSEAYWKAEVAKIDLKHAAPFAPPSAFGGPESHTTHFVVADQWGNVVSATQTLGNAYGARLMAPGTGIWLNNSLAYCLLEPKGNPRDAQAGRRRLPADCPTIILRHGRVWAALGTPGGDTIGQTVPQIVMNLIDFHMDIARALAAPRVSFVEPDVLAVEEGIGAATRDALSRLGHNVRVVSSLGNAHGLTIEYDAKGQPVRFRGAADPRGIGSAKGF